MAHFYSSLALSFVLMFPEPTVFALAIAVGFSLAVLGWQSIARWLDRTDRMSAPAEPVLSIEG